MASAKLPNGTPRQPRRPATSDEARESQLISLAVDVAEEQMRNGNASAQVITHYLKLGSSRERLEQTKIRHELELTQAKIDHLQSMQRMEEMYEGAISAFKSYTGEEEYEPDEEEWQ